MSKLYFCILFTKELFEQWSDMEYAQFIAHLGLRSKRREGKSFKEGNNNFTWTDFSDQSSQILSAAVAWNMSQKKTS